MTLVLALTAALVGPPGNSPHAFTPDLDLGTDGGLHPRHVCVTCRKPGRVGDAQHPVDAPLAVGTPPVICPPVPDGDVSGRIVGDRSGDAA